MTADTTTVIDALTWHDLLRRTPLAATPGGAPGTEAILASRLLDPDVCLSVLDVLTPQLGSPTRKITASLLSKRIAFLVTAPALYAMSCHDRGLDLRLERFHLGLGLVDGVWQSQLILHSPRASAPPAGERQAWRADLVAQLFGAGLGRLWAVFTQVSGVSPRILWENTAARVYSLYERRILAEGGCAAGVRRRARDDYAYLVSAASAIAFGARDNPLATYFFDKRVMAEGQEPVRVRKTCCFYFRAGTSPSYCDGCPLLYPRGQRQR